MVVVMIVTCEIEHRERCCLTAAVFAMQARAQCFVASAQRHHVSVHSVKSQFTTCRCKFMPQMRLCSTTTTSSCSSSSSNSSSSSRSSSASSIARMRALVVFATPEDFAFEDQPKWALPPTTWISAIAADLPSVDVDSMAAYNHLLQESLVLQPSLLMQSPQQVAASIVVLERCLRLSAVWLGPSAVSQLLTSYNPASLAGHLSDLLGVWLSAGQVPHSFGQLWLEAPEALSHWDGPSFERHLAALQQELPDMPIGLLLSSSNRLAGVLLSLRDASHLQGHVLRHGGYLIIAPYFSNISVQEVVVDVGGTVDATKSGGQLGTRILAVYGCNKQHADDAGVEINRMMARELERGVFDRQQLGATNNSSSTRGCGTRNHLLAASDACVGSEVDLNTADEPMLLMQLDIRPLREPRLMPVVILPPREFG